jgi:hypothetical protein
MSRPKSNRILQSSSGISIPDGAGRLGSAGFATAIAQALRREFGLTKSAVKDIVKLTSANERAIKNWLQGRNGPSGEFLILLCRHSDEVLETVLFLSGRTDLIAAKKFVDAKQKLREILASIDEMEALIHSE